MTRWDIILLFSYIQQASQAAFSGAHGFTASIVAVMILSWSIHIGSPDPYLCAPPGIYRQMPVIC